VLLRRSKEIPARFPQHAGEVKSASIHTPKWLKREEE
jgi:hypothetical protein